MPHDVIDNLNEKLIDHVERILSSTERAEFAVGYLFLSGLKPLQEHLSMRLWRYWLRAIAIWKPFKRI